MSLVTIITHSYYDVIDSIPHAVHYISKTYNSKFVLVIFYISTFSMM